MSAVVRLYEPGGPEALRYESETVGEPAAGQVRIRQEAIGVNYVDTYFRSGRFPLPVLPAVIGGEGAGVVDAVGEGVDSISVGDRIGYYFSPGAYAETRLLSAAEAIPLPHDLGATEAASLLAQGLTAWGRLFRVHAVRPGDVVLVTGATGGVGSLLATWAQHLGATVITPVASKDRVEAAEALGLQHVVVAGTGQLSEAMTELGGKADVVYDLVGRATFAEVVSVLRDGGTLDLIGTASGDARHRHGSTGESRDPDHQVEHRRAPPRPRDTAPGQYRSVPGLARWCLRQASRPHLSPGRRGPGPPRPRSRHPRGRGRSSPTHRLIPKGPTMLHGAEHIRRYEETDGKEGHIWLNDAPTLILTTKGRKSGQDRKSALIYQQSEGRYVVVASDGGAAKHPSWYLNLLAHPDVTVQVAANKFTAIARTATPDERAKLWPLMTSVWPDYASYERKTTREIPLVILDPTT